MNESTCSCNKCGATAKFLAAYCTSCGSPIDHGVHDHVLDETGAPSRDELMRSSRDFANNVAGRSLTHKAFEYQQKHPIRSYLALVFRVHTDERAWRLGAVGEKRVARQLSRLPASWKVIHSIEYGKNGSDIDHLVIGPGGVFTINSKNHLNSKVVIYPYAMYVGGRKQPYIPKAINEAKIASACLSKALNEPVATSPILVIMSRDLKLKGRPDAVNIVFRKNLVRWLKRRTPRLSEAQIARLFTAARNPATWQ